MSIRQYDSFFMLCQIFCESRLRQVLFWSVLRAQGHSQEALSLLLSY